MTSIATWIKKATIIAIVLMVGAFSVPVDQAFAGTDMSTAAAAVPSQVSNDRLERVWSKELRFNNKLSKFFDVVDGRISKGQALIDKAKANGKDVSAVQAALDAFSLAVKQARPIYKGAQGIVSGHLGFDQNGKVTDLATARETVRTVKDQFKQIHLLLHTPRHELRQAIQNFRMANGLPMKPTQPGA